MTIEQRYRFYRLFFYVVIALAMIGIAAFVLFTGSQTVHDGQVVVGITVTPSAISLAAILLIVGAFVLGHTIGKEST